MSSFLLQGLFLSFVGFILYLSLGAKALSVFHMDHSKALDLASLLDWSALVTGFSLFGEIVAIFVLTLGILFKTLWKKESQQVRKSS